MVGAVANPLANVKSSAAATAAMTVTFFMAIFRSLRVQRNTMYADL